MGSAKGRAPSGSPTPRAWWRPAPSVHVGLRGPALNANSARLCRELGYRTIGVDEILDGGIAATLAQVREIVGDRPTYLCWDLDVFDPSVAPGVFSPSWGGLDAAAGMRLLRGLAGLRLVAADVDNIDPPRDLERPHRVACRPACIRTVVLAS